jgi:hypothetical protein
VSDINALKALAAAKGWDWEAIKLGVSKFLPLLEYLASLTPTTFDDAAVQFLKFIVASASPAGPPA